VQGLSPAKALVLVLWMTSIDLEVTGQKGLEGRLGHSLTVAD
jgi:hypothetical protein